MNASRRDSQNGPAGRGNSRARAKKGHFTAPESFLQPAEQPVPGRLAVETGYRVREWYLFRTGLDAVLRVATIRYSARPHDGGQPHVPVHLARRVLVEEPDLIQGGRADELRVRVDLRADFQADGARHAARHVVAGRLHLRRDPRPRPQVVRAVDIDPRVHFLEPLEEAGAVDHQVADEGELRHRLDGDRLFDLIDEGRAAHPRQAVRLPDDGRGLAAAGRDRVLLNVHETGQHVFALAVRYVELFPPGRRLR